MSDNLILIGMMGAGKSTVGRLLAEKWQRNFCDIDAHIEEATGMSVTDIFAHEGEAGFRQRESKALNAVLAEGAQIIATGGGVVTIEDNIRSMRQRGTVVYLSATAKLLTARLNTEGMATRPLLANGSDNIVSLLAKREENYQTAAHIVVSQTTMENPTQVADKVLAALAAV